MTFERKLDASIIADLGGTIKIGELKATLPTQTIKDAFGDKIKQAQRQICEIIASSVVDAMAFSKAFWGERLLYNNYLQSALGNIQRLWKLQ
jgi:hypothetical protein